MRTSVNFKEQTVSLESSSGIKIKIAFFSSPNKVTMYSVNNVLAFISTFTSIQLKIDLHSLLLPGIFKFDGGFACITEAGLKHLLSGLICYVAN